MIARQRKALIDIKELQLNTTIIDEEEEEDGEEEEEIP